MRFFQNRAIQLRPGVRQAGLGRSRYQVYSEQGADNVIESAAVSHWKYIIGNVIVYRDVYRGLDGAWRREQIAATVHELFRD